MPIAPFSIDGILSPYVEQRRSGRVGDPQPRGILTRGLSQNEGLEALRVAKAAVDLSAFWSQRTRCLARFLVGRKRAKPRTL